MEATFLIEDLGQEGEGVGRSGGRVLFVPRTTVGDEVRASFPDDGKPYARARLIEIVRPSPERVTPECPLYETCGGCQTMDLSYGAELRVKERRLHDALQRLGGIARPPVEPIVPAPHTAHYRMKATMPASPSGSGLIFGYYRRGSHHLVDVSDCTVLDPEVQRTANIIRDALRQAGVPAWDEARQRGVVRSLMVRRSHSGGGMQAVLTVTRSLADDWARGVPEAQPLLTGLLVAVEPVVTNRLVGDRPEVVWGEPTIREHLLGKTFRVSPTAFFQANPEMAEALFTSAAQAAGGEGTSLLDLYAGTGTLAILLAEGRESVEGIEVIGAAVRDARANARLNGLGHVRFFSGEAASVFRDRISAGVRYDTLTLDPPRKGAQEAVPLMLEARPTRIIYVSCDPATLARDVALLGKGGYTLVSARPFDLFPRTVHVEALAVLERAHG